MTALAMLALIVGVGVLEAYAPRRFGTRLAQAACLLVAAHLFAVSALVAVGVS